MRKEMTVCFAHSLRQMVGSALNSEGHQFPNKGGPGYISDAAFFASSLITQQRSGSIHRRDKKKEKRKNWQCWRMQPSPSDQPETVSSQKKEKKKSLTWPSPSPPPPRARASRPRLAVSQLLAPRRAGEAPARTTAPSSPTRSRSWRSRGVSGGRWRAPAPAGFVGGGPAALWPSRWWRWCVTPSVRSCKCYCRFELSAWSPGPVFSCSRTSWSLLAP